MYRIRLLNLLPDIYRFNLTRIAKGEIISEFKVLAILKKHLFVYCQAKEMRMLLQKATKKSQPTLCRLALLLPLYIEILFQPKLDHFT